MEPAPLHRAVNVEVVNLAKKALVTVRTFEFAVDLSFKAIMPR